MINFLGWIVASWLILIVVFAVGGMLIGAISNICDMLRGKY